MKKIFTLLLLATITFTNECKIKKPIIEQNYVNENCNSDSKPLNLTNIVTYQNNLLDHGAVYDNDSWINLEKCNEFVFITDVDYDLKTFSTHINILDSATLTGKYPIVTEVIEKIEWIEDKKWFYSSSFLTQDTLVNGMPMLNKIRWNEIKNNEPNINNIWWDLNGNIYNLLNKKQKFIYEQFTKLNLSMNVSLSLINEKAFLLGKLAPNKFILKINPVSTWIFNNIASEIPVVHWGFQFEINNLDGFKDNKNNNYISKNVIPNISLLSDYEGFIKYLDEKEWISWNEKIKNAHMSI